MDLSCPSGRARIGALLLAVWLGACVSPPAAPVADVPIDSRAAEPVVPAPPAAPPAKGVLLALPEIDRLPDDFPHGGEARTAADVDLIVIHSIGGPTCRNDAVYFTPANGSAVFWRDWFLGEGGKSIHYVIGREGDIAQQRPELRTAGHVSFGGIVTEVNRRSIGIELVNRGDGIDPFPVEQLASLALLVSRIAVRYDLPPEALVTHAALDDRMQADCGGEPLRRNLDPGPLFPLEDVRAAVWAEPHGSP